MTTSSGKPGESRYADTSGTRDYTLSAVQAAAIVVIVLAGLIFLTNQKQRPDITFGGMPQAVGVGAPTPTQVTPSYAEIANQYAGQKIVRLPGAIANIDEQAALDAMAATDVTQIVIAPPLAVDGGDEIEVPKEVLLISGLAASLWPYSTSGSTFDSFARTFALNDVTPSVLTLLAKRLDRKAEGSDDAPINWREPTAQEAADVIADVQDDGIAFVSGATPFDVPTKALQGAFPDQEPVVVVAPTPALGQLPVDYAATLLSSFPNRPVVLMTGTWIRYDGAETAADRDAVTASFYGQLDSRLSKYAYPQESVLRASLSRVEQFRYGEAFRRATPYVPPDPVGVTLPFLPWLCAGLGVVCIGASLRATGRSRPIANDLVTAEQLSQYAGLSELAVEINPLAAGQSAERAMTRALASLREADDLAGDPQASAEDMQALLVRAEADLGRVADAIKRPDYSPPTFLAGRWR